jgi:hypothetical protein
VEPQKRKEEEEEREEKRLHRSNFLANCITFRERKKRVPSFLVEPFLPIPL